MPARAPALAPSSVVIVGTGAAGSAAAECSVARATLAPSPSLARTTTFPTTDPIYPRTTSRETHLRIGSHCALVPSISNRVLPYAQEHG
jgi:hypothetical protein